MFRSTPPEGTKKRVGEEERSPEEAARNEAVFRDANELLDERRRALEIDDSVPYLCECEDPGCTQTVVLSPDEYERARSDARTFLVAPGHETDGARTVERNERYWIVLKQGVAGDVAAELDPRANGSDLTAGRPGR
jgi:hypothetical protein